MRATVWIALLCGSACVAQDRAFPVKSNLRAGVAKVDVTPPIGTPMGGYAERTGPSTGVRDPLRAAVLVLDDGTSRAAIVTADWLAIRYDEVAALRKAVSEKARVPESNVLAAVSHTHGSPWPALDSDYGRLSIAKIAGAAAAAAADMHAASLGYGEDSISFNVNRRYPTPEGGVVFRAYPDGPIDRRVKVLRVDDGLSLNPMAVLMHAVCHANVFRGKNTRLTADFPGDAQTFVEKALPRTEAFFLQGCTGDVRANLPGISGPEWFRDGDEADMLWAATDLGAAAVRASARMATRDELAKRPASWQIKSVTSTVLLPGKDQIRTRGSMQDRMIVREGGRNRVRCDLQALRVGDILFLTIPGEPLVEIGLKTEKALAGRAKLFVVGYANGYIGYIPTAESYKRMGYEPESSPLSAEAEAALLEALGRVANQALAR